MKDKHMLKTHRLRFSAALCASILCTAPLAAEEKVDHLQPQVSMMEAPPADDIAAVLRAVFPEAWKSDVRAKMFSITGAPSDFRSEMLLLKKDAGNFRVVLLSVPGVLATYTKIMPQAFREARHPRDYHHLTPKRCEAQLDGSAGASIIEAWRNVLMETRYYKHEHQPPPDSGWSDFSMQYQGQLLSGTIPIPAEENSKPSLLMHITDGMRDLCVTKSDKDRKQLGVDLRSFLMRQ